MRVDHFFSEMLMGIKSMQWNIRAKCHSRWGVVTMNNIHGDVTTMSVHHADGKNNAKEIFSLHKHQLNYRG